jgi:hypothetical protein
MSQSQAVVRRRKVPTAANEELPPPRRHLREFAGWIVAAVLLLGAGAYSLLDRGEQSRPIPDSSAQNPPTLVLQQPQIGPRKQAGYAQGKSSSKARMAAQGESTERTANRPSKIRDGSPVAQTKVAVAVNATDRTAELSNARLASKKHTLPSPAIAQTAAPPQPTYSDSHLSPSWPRPGVHNQQVLGRVVHVGAFAEMGQAKLVWGNMVRSYPAVGKFEPSLIANRDWNGRPFYQFQVETASLADSQMLCQSIERFNFRCAIVGVRSKP